MGMIVIDLEVHSAEKKHQQSYSGVQPVPNAAGLPITNDFNLSGFIGGFDVGCDWQWGVFTSRVPPFDEHRL